MGDGMSWCGPRYIVVQKAYIVQEKQSREGGAWDIYEDNRLRILVPDRWSLLPFPRLFQAAYIAAFTR